MENISHISPDGAEYLIRPAETRDVYDMSRCIFEAMRRESPDFAAATRDMILPWRNDLITQARAPDGSDVHKFAWIVEQADKFIGYGRYVLHRKNIYFAGCFIDPAHQRRGLARKLTEIRLSHAVEREAENAQIWIAATPAKKQWLNFWMRLGFDVTAFEFARVSAWQGEDAPYCLQPMFSLTSLSPLDALRRLFIPVAEEEPVKSCSRELYGPRAAEGFARLREIAERACLSR